MKNLYAGIYPAVITPFTTEGWLDTAALKLNITRWNTTGLRGYLVIGSTSEAPLLTDGEREEIIGAVVESKAENMLLLAGTGKESTTQTIISCKVAANAGADIALVITPWFYKPLMTAEVLETHYLRVAESSPIPIFLYNMPKFAGITIPLQTISKLAQHPNILGIKDSSGNIPYLAHIVHNTPAEFAVLTGSAPTMAQALISGATGAILAVANLAPEICVALYQAIQNKNLNLVQQHQQQLQLISEVSGGTYGIGSLKYAMNLLNYAAGVPRPPLLSPPEEYQEKIKNILKTVNSEQ